MEFPTADHDSFIIIPHTFAASRIYEEDDVSHISATSITLKISCSPIDDENLSGEEIGKKAVIGFQRLKVWLEGMLDHIILIDVSSELFPPLQAAVGNQIMITPGKPDDSMLAVLLHSKATAITSGCLEVFTLSLTATDTDNIERLYRCQDKIYPLPGIEYFPGEAVHKTPWWTRPTIDISEYIKEDGDDSIEWNIEDPLAEIGKDYLTIEKEADIIVFDAWKKKEK